MNEFLSEVRGVSFPNISANHPCACSRPGPYSCHCQQCFQGDNLVVMCLTFVYKTCLGFIQNLFRYSGKSCPGLCLSSSSVCWWSTYSTTWLPSSSRSIKPSCCLLAATTSCSMLFRSTTPPGTYRTDGGNGKTTTLVELTKRNPNTRSSIFVQCECVQHISKISRCRSAWRQLM